MPRIRRLPRRAAPSENRLGMRAALGLFANGVLLAIAAAGVAQPMPDSFVRDAAPERQAEVRSQFGPGFHELETDHFRVVSDTSPRYHRVVSGVLKQFYQEVRPRFFERDMPPLPFYLIDAGADFDRFVAQRGFPSGGAFGFYDPDTRALYARRYFADGRESGVGTLFHESLHAMIDAEFALERPPVWFHEGFASLFEAGRVLRGRWVYGNPNPWREVAFRVAFEAGRVPSLTDLLSTPDAVFRGEELQRNLYYNAGRSLFLSLLLNQGEPALREFIRGLRAGDAVVPALEQATGLSLERIETAWHRSIRDVNFGGDYLERGSGPRGLEILIDGARRYPRYGNLRVRLAGAYLEIGNREAAIENARAALADPRCIQPQLALSILAQAIITTNAQEAARALHDALGYQPWNEVVMQYEFEMRAWMYEQVGDAARADALRSELVRLQQIDRSARAPGRPVPDSR